MTSKTVQLLLVEDDQADAKFLRACLARSKGSKPDIVHASCLNDALALLKDTRFDVILLDLNLPDATGEVSVSKIQEAHPKIPIVVLSGEDNEDYAIGILNQGVQDYLVKWDGEGSTILRSIRYAIERKRTELRLAFLATYDSLTEIPNRNFFVDHLKKAVSRAQRNGSLLGLVFLDLDRFKGVNDTLGHYFGDKLLCAVAKRISAAVRNGDIVARMGGDEFAILLENMNDTQAAETVARKLINVLAEPYELDGHSVNVTISVGITIYPKDDGDPQTLVKNADMAMYQAKSAGRNCYQFFNEKMHDEIVRQHQVAQDLRRALDNREFSLLYQPQFRLDDGRLDGAEALIRWNHPEKKLVMPND
ncbi:MAG: diguanylate cyclase, partial [Gammaproteobacteria bacterium]|nr:diguanylate cyclase [Gammaproteobacteria bacterium]